MYVYVCMKWMMVEEKKFGCGCMCMSLCFFFVFFWLFTNKDLFLCVFLCKLCVSYALNKKIGVNLCCFKIVLLIL